MRLKFHAVALPCESHFDPLRSEKVSSNRLCLHPRAILSLSPLSILLLSLYSTALYSILYIAKRPVTTNPTKSSPQKMTSSPRACSLFDRSDGLTFAYKVLNRSSLTSGKTPLVLVTGCASLSPLSLTSPLTSRIRLSAVGLIDWFPLAGLLAEKRPGTLFHSFSCVVVGGRELIS